MIIKAIKLENFYSMNHDISSIILDPNDLNTVIGIENPYIQAIVIKQHQFG
jgi:hypothetical protein